MISKIELSNVNFNLLKTFKIFAETQSFVKTSQLLYVTQPAISKAMKLLEKEIEVKLFYKSGRKIILTEEGRILYSCINKISMELNTTFQRIEESLDISNGTLRIGVQSHFARFFLLDKIDKFIKKYPNIKIKLLDMPTRQLLIALENREIDFVIDALPIDNIFKNLKIIPLIEEKTCFVVSHKYKESIKDISAEKIILPLARSSIRKALELILVEQGITLKPFLEVETTDLIIESVKRGLGVGFVMKKAVDEYIKRGEFYEIDLIKNLPSIRINYIGIKDFQSVLSKIFLTEAVIKMEE